MVKRRTHSKRRPARGSRAKRRRIKVQGERPTTADQLFALPDRKRNAFEQVTRLVSRMRDDRITLRWDRKAGNDDAIRAPSLLRRGFPEGAAAEA